MYREGGVGADLAQAVDGLAGDVHHAAAYDLASGHGDGGAGGDDLHAAAEAVGGVHRHAAHGVLADVLLHFYDEIAAVNALYLEGFVDGRQGIDQFVVGEVNIHHRADDLGNMSYEY